MTRRRPGTLVLSLDTEFVWGTFESGHIDPERYDGTRTVVRKLLDLFDTYDIPVTWALVTHLLTDCRDAGADVHSFPGECRDPRAGTLPCQQGLNPALWYEPSILDWISGASVDHEVALHSHTHPIFDEIPLALAHADVEASLEVADHHGMDPSSFVFPQNRVAHREILEEAGIDAYRGVDARWYERQPLPEPAVKAARFAEEALELTPPIVTPRLTDGLVEIPGSQLFRPYHGGWQYTPRQSQTTRAIKGLNRTAARGGLFHIWFHPFNFARDTTALLAAFEKVLSHANSLVEGDRLEIRTMASVADSVRNSVREDWGESM